MRTPTFALAALAAAALAPLASASPFTLGLSGGLASQAVCDATQNCPATNGWTAGVSLGIVPETPNIISGGILVNGNLTTIGDARALVATASPVFVLGPQAINAYAGPSVGFDFTNGLHLLVGALAGAQVGFGGVSLYAELQLLDDTTQPYAVVTGTGVAGVRFRF